MILITNATVLTEDKLLFDSAVFINEGKIKDIGDTAVLKASYPDAYEIDAKEGVVMPGLINAHMHLYSTFARGMSLPEAPKNFVEILDKLWWKLDKALTDRDIYYSSLIPLIDCVKSGTTTILDHHASPGCVLGSLSKIEEALDIIPIRAALCYEVSDRDGQDVAELGIRENVDFIEAHEKNEMVKGMFGLHASMTLCDETLAACSQVVDDFGVGLHVHTAESKTDQEDCMQKYGMRIVERWEKFGLLSPKTILAHSIHINKKEMDLIKKYKSNVVQNPESNMNNAVGVTDVPEMFKKGLCVGLGTDGMTTDMFQESKFAHLISKHNKQDPCVGFNEAGKMLFENNKKIASKVFGYELGVIKKGAVADVIILDYKAPTPMTNDNFLGHFLYGMSSMNVVTTIVNGKVLMQDRKVTCISEEDIDLEARKCAEEVWKRL